MERGERVHQGGCILSFFYMMPTRAGSRCKSIWRKGETHYGAMRKREKAKIVEGTGRERRDKQAGRHAKSKGKRRRPQKAKSSSLRGRKEGTGWRAEAGWLKRRGKKTQITENAEGKHSGGKRGEMSGKNRECVQNGGEKAKAIEGTGRGRGRGNARGRANSL